MIKILLSAIFFCFLTVTVPVSYGASVCDNLNNNKTACCAQLDAKDNKTNVCQYVLCNGTGACSPAGVEQKCQNVTNPDTCPHAASTTQAPAGSTTNKNASTAAPVTSTAAPSTGTTQTQDVCANKTQLDCCNVKDDKNITLCQFMLCTGNTTGACFNKSKPLADICGAAPATGTDKCIPTTPAPSSTTANKSGSTLAPTPTTQPAQPKCEDKVDNTTCCAFKIGTSLCQWVNCTDAKTPTAIHQGCHGPGENLTGVCVTGTQSILCNAAPGSSTSATSTSTPKPTGGAQPSTGGKPEGRHFDAASFIGGIVLCAGIIAIVFFGLKFYKARTERNYHTLH